MDGILTSTINPGQSGLGSNGNEEVVQISRTGTSPSDAV